MQTSFCVLITAILFGPWYFGLNKPKFLFTLDLDEKLYKFDKNIIAIDGFDDYYKEFGYKD